jgi:hypothetical protein
MVKRRILLFVLICLLAFTLGFVTLTPSLALKAVRLTGYWIIVAGACGGGAGGIGLDARS